MSGERAKNDSGESGEEWVVSDCGESGPREGSLLGVKSTE